MVAVTLVQLIVIVLVARGGNLLLRRFGQPGAVGEIMAGLALGPSLLGALFPAATHALFRPEAAPPIQILSQIGLILLMFQIGSEFHFGHLGQKTHARAVGAIAAASIGVPLAAGLVLAWCLAPALAAGVDRGVFSLFFAVAMSITAVPILGRILREFGLTQTPLGVIAISAAAINDVVGWLLLAVVSSIATARFSLAGTLAQIGAVILFAAVLRYGGRPLVGRLMRQYPVVNGAIDNGLMAIVIGLLLAAAVCTSAIGLFAIFGGFAVGLLFHTQRAFVEAWRRQIGQFVLVFFLPIFFTYSGLRTNLLGLTGFGNWGCCALILGVAVAAKIVPVYLAARGAGLKDEDALTCGVLLNTRALMELVVLNIGLDLGYIPHKVFTMLVVMAVATTVCTAPLLRLLARRRGQVFALAVEA
jgi:Kef-type K+ transport system membrane component KefB